jgi:hypothetical protein
VSSHSSSRKSASTVFKEVCCLRTASRRPQVRERGELDHDFAAL